MPKPVGSTPSQTVHQPLRWPSLAISSSTWRCEGSSTPYNSSIELRYAVRVGALPVSILESVDGARPRRSATSSSLMDCASRSRRNSLPSLRRRTVGPTVTGTRLLIGKQEACLGPDGALSPGTWLPDAPGCHSRYMNFLPFVRSHVRFRRHDLCYALACRASSHHDGTTKGRQAGAIPLVSVRR